jgi:hypothetical protein
MFHYTGLVSVSVHSIQQLPQVSLCSPEYKWRDFNGFRNQQLWEETSNFYKGKAIWMQ